MGDPEDQLDDMANCNDSELLVDADSIPSVVRKYRGFVLERDFIIHGLRLEAKRDTSSKGSLRMEKDIKRIYYEGA